MKTKLLNLSLFVFFAFVSVGNAHAQLLLKENFEYTTGAALELQPTWDWISSQATLPIMVESGAYSYTDYPASGIGNKVVVGATGEDLYRTFPKQSTGSVYYSCLVNVTAATTAGEYFMAFSSNPIDKTLYHGRVYVKKDASNNLAFGVNRVSSSVTGYTGFTYALNTTYLIVLKYEFVTGTINDKCSLTINPVIASGEAAATWLTTTATDAGGEAGSLIGAIALRQVNSSTAVKVSGLRVAASWTDLMDNAASVSGIVIATDEGVKTGFIATTAAPSAAQTFKVSATGLTADLVITQDFPIPLVYEFSTDGTLFTDAVTLTQIAGTVAETTVSVRRKSDATTSASTKKNVVISSGTANKTYISCAGQVDLSTAITDVNTKLKISSANGMLKVSGVNAGQPLEVYNSVGQRLSSIITVDGENNITLNTKGLLIIKVEKSVNKVVM